MRETVKDLRKLSELLKNVIPYWKFADPLEKQTILRIIFSELIVHENSLDYKLTLGFEPFKTRFVSLSARYHTTLELFETMVNNVEMIRSWNISLKELLEKDYSVYVQKVTF